MIKLDHEQVIESVLNWFKTKPQVNLISKGLGEFPNPDLRVQFKDGSLALVECKPSNAEGREYLTGYGQALAYLVYSDFSYLAIPQLEMERFKKYFWFDSLGLLSIVQDNVNLLREPKKSKVIISKEKPRVRGYAYYRDLRPNEICELLKTIQITNFRRRYKKESERTDRVRDDMWKQVTRMRNISSERQKDSWLLNMTLLFRDLNLITSDYYLTNDGISLFKIGEISLGEPYINKLAKQFLVNGNFIDILTIIQELNDIYNGFHSVNEFKGVLEKQMITEKLATQRTNVIRDLQDIPRVLHDLNLISEWKKSGLVYKYNINWKRVLAVIRENTNNK